VNLVVARSPGNDEENFVHNWGDISGAIFGAKFQNMLHFGTLPD